MVQKILVPNRGTLDAIAFTLESDTFVAGALAVLIVGPSM